MRVTSSLWVGAFVRRYNGAGAFGAVVRHGADEAGAIFIVIDQLRGAADLYAPAPQSSFDEGQPSDRLFQRVIESGTPQAIAERLERERRFDADLWTVEVEDREGRIFFEVI